MSIHTGVWRIGAVVIVLAIVHSEASAGDACGEPKTGDCCEPHSFAFCEDEECCVEVCQADPFCCQIAWDVTCAGIALSVCESCSPLQCGDASAGACCESNGTPGCVDLWCCEAVCAEDAFCCNVLWDAKCVSRAAIVCNGCDGPVCRADLNFDGEVDGADLVVALAEWGVCPPATGCLADLTGDGLVDGPDLAELLSAWGACR